MFGDEIGAAGAGVLRDEQLGGATFPLGHGEVQPIELQVGVVVARSPVAPSRPQKQRLPRLHREGCVFFLNVKHAFAHKKQYEIRSGAVDVAALAARNH